MLGERRVSHEGDVARGGATNRRCPLCGPLSRPLPIWEARLQARTSRRFRRRDLPLEAVAVDRPASDFSQAPNYVKAACAMAFGLVMTTGPLFPDLFARLKRRVPRWVLVRRSQAGRNHSPASRPMAPRKTAGPVADPGFSRAEQRPARPSVRRGSHHGPTVHLPSVGRFVSSAAGARSGRALIDRGRRPRDSAGETGPIKGISMTTRSRREPGVPGRRIEAADRQYFARHWK